MKIKIIITAILLFSGSQRLVAAAKGAHLETKLTSKIGASSAVSSYNVEKVTDSTPGVRITGYYVSGLYKQPFFCSKTEDFIHGTPPVVTYTGLIHDVPTPIRLSPQQAEIIFEQVTSKTDPTYQSAPSKPTTEEHKH